jgi:dienelactone hydrolase
MPPCLYAHAACSPSDQRRTPLTVLTVCPAGVTMAMPACTCMPNGCRDPSIGEEGHVMRACRDPVFGTVVRGALMVLMGVLGVSHAHAQTRQTPAVEVTFPDLASTLQLRGYLYRPDGPGPFPAVVALLVDSFTPRGQTNICDDVFRVDPQYARMPDAYAAKAYLARQPFVAAQQIGLIGWSHGGWTTLYAVDAIYLTGINITPFQVAIAFYPWCLPQLRQVNAPLLILIGEADAWTPASRCQDMLRQSERLGEQMADRITLRVYPGAPHAFDSLTPPSTYHGHTVGRHPEAAGQADAEVKRFLAQHLAIKP